MKKKILFAGQKTKQKNISNMQIPILGQPALYSVKVTVHVIHLF